MSQGSAGRYCNFSPVARDIEICMKKNIVELQWSTSWVFYNGRNPVALLQVYAKLRGTHTLKNSNNESSVAS